MVYYLYEGLVGGHVPLDSQGQVCGPFGRVGAEVSLEQAQEAARRTLLAILASLKEELAACRRIREHRADLSK